MIPVDSGQIQTKNFNRKQQVWSFLHKEQQAFINKGYLAYSIDSIFEKDTLFIVSFYKGKQYRWAKIDFSGIPVGLWNQLNLSPKNWQNRSISPKKLAMLHEKILTYCEQNGYPFATTRLDSFQNNCQDLNAKFILNKGSLQKIDTVIIKGNVDISRNYLEHYLNIFQGGCYDESQIQKIHKRLNELSFLQESRPWRMNFTIGKNKLYLYLKEKKANQINALVGLQPNTEESGKFQLTADFLLRLHNSFGYGETIETTYKNLSYKSPKFHAHIIAPYVLGSQFDMEGSFNLYKKDSSYRKVGFEIGLRYSLNAESYFRVFYLNSSNRLISPDTHWVRINKKLPENIDIKSHGMGVNLVIDRTDYKRNPQKGWQLMLSAFGKERTIIPNDAILAMDDKINFQQLYNNANKNKYQFRFKSNAALYFPIYRNIIAKINYQGAYIYGKQLFQNELFQIGGYHTLRGFDENSFYADQYHILSLELHFEFDKNSYFYFYNDDAFVSTKFQDFSHKDFPVSFGAGLSLEHKKGIFNVALGIGKRQSEIFQFRNTKIHFGYIAYF